MKGLFLLTVVSLAFATKFTQLSYDQDSDKVRMDLFVMAKCPDALACETTYAPVIQEVGSILDLHVNYIASIDSDGGFDCMHGPGECIGDIQQLCAYYLDSSNNYTWWNFIQCQDQNQDDIPYNGDDCAQQVGINDNLLENCVNGQLGSKLMTQSLTFSQNANVTVSCTIWIQNELFCVHNGDWEQCKTYQVPEIVSYICSLYEGTNPPPACKKLLLI